MAVTARVVVSGHTVNGNGTNVTLTADYADGRNKEWAEATPVLNFSLTVKKELAEEHFPLRKALSVTFEPTVE